MNTTTPANRYTSESDLVTDIIDGTGYVADVAIPASFQMEISRCDVTRAKVAAYVSTMLNVATREDKDDLLKTYKAGLFTLTEVTVLLELRAWLAAKEENELTWWKLNVSLSSNVEEAYFSARVRTRSLGADDVSDSIHHAMLKQGLKAAGRIVPRNDDTEEFYMDMVLYYMNAATYGFVDEENETPGQAEAAKRMTAFETKFNKVIRKAIRSSGYRGEDIRKVVLEA
jgi:hypothetical protein